MPFQFHHTHRLLFFFQKDQLSRHPALNIIFLILLFLKMNSGSRHKFPGPSPVEHKNRKRQHKEKARTTTRKATPSLPDSSIARPLTVGHRKSRHQNRATQRMRISSPAISVSVAKLQGQQYKSKKKKLFEIILHD